MGREKALERKYLRGRSIEPIRLRRGMSVRDLVEVYAGMGFNARRLAESCQVYENMLRANATICLTLAGAMTPIGMSGALITLLENGWVDWVIATGANLYHDLHRAFDFPMRQGHFAVDDNELKDAGIARIYDVFIQEGDTMIETDRAIVEAFINREFTRPVSTADVHAVLGQEVNRRAPAAGKSFVGCAAALGVPVYVASPGDSSIGMNLVINYLEGNRVPVDPSLDVLETAALVRAAKKNGALMIGGGAPKNFFMQTQPTLWQILEDNQGGHDFFVQYTADAPHWGGLSGATASEARSWGKVKDATINNVTAYCDASIALPLLTAWLLATQKPRRRRNLLAKKEAALQDLVAKYRANRVLHARIERVKRRAAHGPAKPSARRRACPGAASGA
ncbi:MAG TPA: deoxyhypusine synthase [Candidatus Methanoperedens sp.]|nr:deoxyhypusine synthase [Candidatus Methanoperedens sp.]